MANEPFERPIRTIDLMTVPRERWYRLAYFMSHVVPDNSADSADWIDRSYGDRDRLRALLDFIASDLAEGVRGDLGALDRVWFFPWTEAAAEVEYAFAYAMAGLHRACVDHHRRALELVIVGAYFVADNVDSEAGAAWLSSEKATPLFSRALKALRREDFFSAFDDREKWTDDVTAHYWRLSDTVHVRGREQSLQELQNASLIYAGFPVPNFSVDLLERNLELLMTTCQHMLVALVVANPVLLFGMPLQEKYGINEPIGFFTDDQAKRLRALLSQKLLGSLLDLAERDSRVQSIREHFASMPDISQAEIARQLDDLPWGA